MDKVKYKYFTSLTWFGSSNKPLGSTELKNLHNDWNTNITDGDLDKFCKDQT